MARAISSRSTAAIGWAEIAKNLLTAKLPVLGAGQEWKAVQRLREAGVPSMTAVAYGERGSNPADQHSFIITQELAPTIDLEVLSLNWVKQPPEPALKRAPDRRGGTPGRHDAPRRGQPPRLLHLPLSAAHRQADHGHGFQLSVIDLHRAQVRPRITRRWRDKDLAALYFSALDIGLTRRDKLRFLRDYFQHPLRRVLKDEARLLGWLDGKANKLYDRKQRYGEAL